MLVADISRLLGTFRTSIFQRTSASRQNRSVVVVPSFAFTPFRYRNGRVRAAAAIRGNPIAVGGSRERGVVAGRSGESR